MDILKRYFPTFINLFSSPKNWLCSIVVGLVIFSVFLWFTGYKKTIYNEGYKSGYAQAIKENPTYSNVGTVVNQAPEPKREEYRVLGIRLNVWKFKLGLGI